jgi:type II secretory pathway pseudopilin PulG
MKTKTGTGARRRGFSLLEVMVAIGVFFMAVFAILGLVSGSLANARRLQRPLVDAGAVASWLSATNRLVEGTYTVNLGDLLGDAYNDYDCTYVIPPSTNKLFEVGYVVQRTTGNHEIVASMTNLIYSPQSPDSSFGASFPGR